MLDGKQTFQQMVNLKFYDHVTEITHEKQRIVKGKPFPLIVTPKPDHENFDFVEWAKENRADLAEELAEYGAILFRGFPFTKAEEFSDFV